MANPPDSIKDLSNTSSVSTVQEYSTAIGAPTHDASYSAIAARAALNSGAYGSTRASIMSIHVCHNLLYSGSAVVNLARIVSFSDTDTTLQSNANESNRSVSRSLTFSSGVCTDEHDTAKTQAANAVIILFMFDNVFKVLNYVKNGPEIDRTAISMQNFAKCWHVL